MSASESSEGQIAPYAGSYEAQPGPRPVRRPPAARFGLRAAVLACVITAAGSTTAGLVAPINSMAGPADTTCCGTRPSISVSS